MTGRKRGFNETSDKETWLTTVGCPVMSPRKRAGRWQAERRRLTGKSGRYRPTAAMMAGLTDHIWTFGELFETVNPSKESREP